MDSEKRLLNLQWVLGCRYLEEVTTTEFNDFSLTKETNGTFKIDSSIEIDFVFHIQKHAILGQFGLELIFKAGLKKLAIDFPKNHNLVGLFDKLRECSTPKLNQKIGINRTLRKRIEKIAKKHNSVRYLDTGSVIEINILYAKEAVALVAFVASLTGFEIPKSFTNVVRRMESKQINFETPEFVLPEKL